ncbi:3-coathanger stack domain-containing protein [Emticicia sp. SJ17W-69]|uniref:3-coathanger stack domain-containing protein n=1 Tax=Emticicia sp. SJ17W-69 TaxID=3421657 RepID=UPI003EBF5FBF
MFRKKRNAQIIAFVLMLIGSLHSNAQGLPTIIEWQKCYGWNGWYADEGSKIISISNGNYAAVGKKALDGFETIWISNINRKGDLIWETTIFDDQSYTGFKGIDIIQSTDGGFIVLGRVNNLQKLRFNATNGRQIAEQKGQGFYDNLVVKLNSEGRMVWFKVLGGSGEDIPVKIIQTGDNNLLLLSYTTSLDGDLVNSNKNTVGFNRDLWVAKLNQDNGNIISKKCIGGSGDEIASDIKQTSDGGYVIVGSTTSNDAEISPNKGGKDILAVKMDASLNVSWKKTYGGSQSDEARKIVALSNGDLIVGITSNSMNNDFDNPISGDFPNNYEGNIWLFKLNSSGDFQKRKILGGSGNDVLNDLIPTQDGNFAITGSTKSSNGNITDRGRIANNNFASYDVVVMKVTSNFDLIWEKTAGGSADDEGNGLVESEDGTFVTIGTTQSFDGDVSGNHYHEQDSHDIWLVKLNYSCQANITTDKDFIATNTDILASETVSTSDKVTKNSSIHYGAGKSIDITSGFDSELGSVLEFNLSGCNDISATESRPIQIKIANECREGGMKFKFLPFTPNSDLSQYRMSIQNLSPKIEFNFSGNTLITKNNIPDNGNAYFVLTVSRDGYEDFSYQGYTSTCEHDNAPINCPENNENVILDKDYYQAGETFTAKWTGTLLPQQSLNWFIENVTIISNSGTSCTGRIDAFPAHIQAQPSSLPDGSRPCHGAIRVDFRGSK